MNFSLPIQGPVAGIRFRRTLFHRMVIQLRYRMFIVCPSSQPGEERIEDAGYSEWQDADYRSTLEVAAVSELLRRAQVNQTPLCTACKAFSGE